MSNIADVSTNSNPHTVLVDDDGYAKTKVKMRRENHRYSMSYVYAPKSDDWKDDVVNVSLLSIKVTEN